MRCTMVSHTHRDREWYRTSQSFRARLVDTVDRVLDLVSADPGYCFQLDGALEDLGDRGDSYDFDAVGTEAASPPVETLDVRRWRHPNGMQGLAVRRVLRVPAQLDPERETRSAASVELPVLVEARITPGVRRVDLHVEVENTARDHRLRLLFPCGSGVDEFHAASTFDTARRSTAPRDDSRWIHPAPRTFPHQGWVCAGGLTVAAPGLPEAEVTPEGCIAITLVRAVGWLSRPDLRSRPGDAGPALATPGAQCLERFEARIHLFEGGPELAPSTARDAELGLRAVAAGPSPLVAEGQGLRSSSYWIPAPSCPAQCRCS